MATITLGVQYSGKWTLQSQAQAVAASTWPVLPTAGGLYMWGGGTSGMLGLGNTTSYSSPKQVGSLNTWTALYSGTNFTVATKSDGTLWSWGVNQAGVGQLGLNNSGTSYSSPKQVGALTNWSQIAVGATITIATKTNGTLWSWGQGDYGGLGHGNETAYSSPKQVGALTSWSKVAASDQRSYAIKTDGTLWAWGNNGLGQLGLGNVTYYSSPVQVGSLTNWAYIQGAQNIVLAIKTNGTLWTWGANGSGQLGLGNTTQYSSPKQVGALTNWAKAYGGNQFAGAIKTDGTLWVWGAGGNGQLGLNNLTSYSSPKQVGSLTSWLSIMMNDNSATLGLLNDGTLWAWGFNSNGQLGLGNRTQYSSPKQIGGLNNWKVLSTRAMVGGSGAIAV